MFLFPILFFLLQKWDPNDEGMIECDSCKLWVHDACDKGVGPVLDNPEVCFVC